MLITLFQWSSTFGKSSTSNHYSVSPAYSAQRTGQRDDETTVKPNLQHDKWTARVMPRATTARVADLRGRRCAKKLSHARSRERCVDSISANCLRIEATRTRWSVHVCGPRHRKASYRRSVGMDLVIVMSTSIDRRRMSHGKLWSVRAYIRRCPKDGRLLAWDWLLSETLSLAAQVVAFII